MQLEIGNIYEGKITEITKFGAFVEIEGKTGMVHISEISNTYVNEIKDHVQVGQTVKVKVINITEEGKVSLSIKKALPQQERPKKNFGGQGGNRNGGQGGQRGGFRDKPRSSGYQKAPAQRDPNSPPPLFEEMEPKKVDNSFEDMLNRFKQTSEEKFSDLKKITDNKRRTGARRK